MPGLRQPGPLSSASWHGLAPGSEWPPECAAPIALRLGTPTPPHSGLMTFWGGCHLITVRRQYIRTTGNESIEFWVLNLVMFKIRYIHCHNKFYIVGTPTHQSVNAMDLWTCYVSSLISVVQPDKYTCLHFDSLFYEHGWIELVESITTKTDILTHNWNGCLAFTAL